MLHCPLLTNRSLAQRSQLDPDAAKSSGDMLGLYMLTALLCALIVLGAAPAWGQVNVNIGIGNPPPPPRIERTPQARPGYVWAPGYWAWDGRRYVWASGHWIQARAGYYYVPDNWEYHAEERGRHWHFAPARWEPEHGGWERDRGHERDWDKHERKDKHKHKKEKHGKHKGHD
jgi:hypothetical protein